MLQIKSYKTEIYPNKKQIYQLKQFIGANRFVYNSCLEFCIEYYKQNKITPSFIEIRKRSVFIKETHNWLYNVPANSIELNIKNLDFAFKNFFSGIYNHKKKIGFPKFKSKKNNKEAISFRLLPIQNKIGYIRLTSKLSLKLSQKNYLPLHLKIKKATISCNAGRWFVSICVEHEIQQLETNDFVLGVDVGIKTLATCSDGSTYANPKSTYKHQKKLKRKDRKLKRKQRGSKNRERQKLKLQRFHYKIANVRKDAIHKMTTSIIQRANVIKIEDLSASNMIKNRKLSKAIQDASFYEIKRQLIYKAKWYGREIILVDRFYPSSKTCSCCGVIKEKLSLSERVFSCDDCGHEMDRDLNAAINLKNYCTVGFTGSQALGDGSSLDVDSSIQDSLSMKKESGSHRNMG